MSDEIKTQHGTIGLLMAECEQLRRDLAKTRGKLMVADSLWQQFKAELTQAKAEIERLRQQLNSEKVKP